MVSAFNFQTRDRRIKPPLAIINFIYIYIYKVISKFFRNVFGFLEARSWILQLIILNFSRKLLINSRNITGKNFCILAALKFPGTCLGFFNIVCKKFWNFWKCENRMWHFFIIYLIIFYLYVNKCILLKNEFYFFSFLCKL